MHTHRVTADVGATYAADGDPHLGGLEDGLLHCALHRERGGERDRGVAHGFDEERPLVELRHELRSEPRHEKHGARKDGHGRDHRTERMRRDPFECGAIRALEPMRHPLSECRLARAVPEEPGADRRHRDEGEQETTEERHRHGQRHRAEHARFESFETHDRKVDDHDDEHAEGDRAPHLMRGAHDPVSHRLRVPR